jgi:hypothetical protein
VQLLKASEAFQHPQNWNPDKQKFNYEPILVVEIATDRNSQEHNGACEQINDVEFVRQERAPLRTSEEAHEKIKTKYGVS